MNAWNNKHVSRNVPLAVLLLVAQSGFALADDALPAVPKLLLSAQRLRRLRRDRDRKTTRWVNFENRINAVPASAERGFELALYYAVTGDAAKGRGAIAWALSHAADRRQSLLVLDWCAPLVSAEQREKLSADTAAFHEQASFRDERNQWFDGILSGNESLQPNQDAVRRRLNWLMDGGYSDAEELYALCEMIYVARASTHVDFREIDPHFFANLPSLVLLSAKPRALNAPNWKMHAAALALVAIDPNLPSSQFLQSWALEDNQTIREGPGVAYELLWADPYLPGVGYQNMDTWTFDERAHLFARANWEPDSCWIAVSPAGVQQENCPPNWQTQTVTFGHLLLIPMLERCVDIPHLANNETVLVWKVKPGERITHGKGKEQYASEADAAGLWRPGANVEGKVCLAPAH